MDEIRRYRPDDHDRVWELHNVALHGVGAHAGNGPWDEDLHRVEEAYIAAGGEFLVGTLGGRVVAIGALRRLARDTCELTRMRVHPGSQRRGYGRRMLARLLERARELGFSRIELTTTVQQTGARRLYEGAGFVRAGSGTEHGFRVIRYEMSLDERRRSGECANGEE